MCLTDGAIWYDCSARFLKIVSTVDNLRNAISILLFFVLAMQLFSRELIIVNYYFHQSEYSQACENKNRPVLHCYGKCLLKKMISNAAGNEQKNEKRTGREELPISSNSFFASSTTQPAVKKNDEPLTIYICNKPAEPLFDIFHPPRFS